VIEFISKLDVIEPDTEIEAKTISELNALKNKINAHIIYTQEYIHGFLTAAHSIMCTFYYLSITYFLNPKKLLMTWNLLIKN
jgi:uncharacterized membrane protein YqhA